MPREREGGGRLPGQVLQILAKDLRVEWRSREIIYTMVLFAALVVLMFAFALGSEAPPRGSVVGGILWIVVAFTGSLGLSRLFDGERERRGASALLLACSSPAAIYLAKLAGVLLFVGVVEAVVLPLMVLLFDLALPAPGLLALTLLLGTLGFCAVGTLFSAGLMQARGRAVLLSILLFPIATPVIVAGSKATAALLSSPVAPDQAMVWIKLLVVFDAVFVTLSLWAFGPLLRED